MKPGLIVLFSITGIFLLIILIKAVVAVWRFTFDLAGWVAALLNWLVSVAVGIASIAGVIVLAFLAVLILGTLLRQVVEQAKQFVKVNREMLTKLEEHVKSKPERFAATAITGIVQSLIIILKDSAFPPSIKVLLSVAVWTLSTLINLAISEKKTNRDFGKWALLLMFVIPIGIAITALVHLNLTEPLEFQQRFQQFWAWLSGLPTSDKLASGMILLFIILIPVAVIVLRRGRK